MNSLLSGLEEVNSLMTKTVHVPVQLSYGHVSSKDFSSFDILDTRPILFCICISRNISITLPKSYFNCHSYDMNWSGVLTIKKSDNT